jgi:hypothetical protein
VLPGVATGLASLHQLASFNVLKTSKLSAVENFNHDKHLAPEN